MLVPRRGISGKWTFRDTTWIIKCDRKRKWVDCGPYRRSPLADPRLTEPCSGQMSDMLYIVCTDLTRYCR